jgi:hypothetical protein
MENFIISSIYFLNIMKFINYLLINKITKFHRINSSTTEIDIE